MTSFKTFTTCLFAIACISWLGCTEDAASPANATAEPAMLEEDLGEVAALSAEDQALVDAQKICPVGGGPLGGMGLPVKVMVEGKAVFICCEHCREPLLKDPAKYLAKLKEANAEETEDAPKEGLEAPEVEPTPAS